MRVFVYRALNAVRRFVTRSFIYTRGFTAANPYGYGSSSDPIGQLQLPPN